MTIYYYPMAKLKKYKPRNAVGFIKMIIINTNGWRKFKFNLISIVKGKK